MKKFRLTPILMLLLCGTVFMASSCNKKCELEAKEGFTVVGTDADCYYNPVSTEPETTYKLGDLYSAGGVKGIVFAVSADKKHGSILAIEYITAAEYQWATLNEVTGATDTLDGAKNMAAVKAMANWATNYPAFKYWDAKGFYIPAKNELRTIFNNYSPIKSAVEKNGGSFDYLNNGTLYSSSEVSNSKFYAMDYLNNVAYFIEFPKLGGTQNFILLGVAKF
jgi:hypothetical protein